MWNFIKKSVAWTVIAIAAVVVTVMFPWIWLVLLAVWAVLEIIDD